MDSNSKQQKAQERIADAERLMQQRWGPPESPVYKMAVRYMEATRMVQHWNALREQHPKRFAEYLEKGYMEHTTIQRARIGKIAQRRGCITF